MQSDTKTKVYIVFDRIDGCDSICAVFSEKETAKMLVKTFERVFVGDVELDLNAPQIKEGFIPFVHIDGCWYRSLKLYLPFATSTTRSVYGDLYIWSKESIENLPQPLGV
jgi:hypothetical protein